MNNETTSSENQARSAAVDGIVDSVVNLGTVWAQHGLAMGQLALKTQSIWLRGLSTLLNQVADAMEPITQRGVGSTEEKTETHSA